jgi:hypothetical protein
MAWRIIRYLSLVTLVLGVAAILFSFYLKDAMATGPGACETIAPDTVRLSGAIGDDMKACALSLLTPQITTVIVDSPGGETFAGRAIGNRIGDVSRTLIVDGICMSSCGNYFVPAAARVELTQGSVVGLHGTPDPFTMSGYDFEAVIEQQVTKGVLTPSEGAGSLTLYAEKNAKELAEETAFATRFDVPMGWRHYREADEGPLGWLRHFTAGSDQGLKPKNMMLVEGAMISSCLPHIETDGWQETLDQSVFSRPLRWTTLKLTGAYRSKGLTCKS